MFTTSTKTTLDVGKCRALWCEREQAIHWGIELL